MSRSSEPEPGSRPRRWGRWLAALYLVALALSHLVRLLDAAPPPLPPGAAAVEVAAVDGDRRLASTVRLVYYRWGPAEDAAGAPPSPPIVLVHGSPGDGGNFKRLAPLLAEEHRVIAPDLPGFGASSRDLPDYSIRAHAHYLLELFDQLGVERAHLVGFSLGGGVILEVAQLAPERVRSVTLLAATAVQEHELLGEYHVNHALHGLQLAGLWLLYEGTPHFGALDHTMLSVAYARNFYDTDQRPLRGILERFNAPMLILHGTRDVLVPYAAAREHYRLVPQSELVAFDDDHFMVFVAPGELAPPLLDFVDRVERGTAPTRADADPARLAAAAAPPPATAARLSGLTLVVALLLLALATLVSEDLTCIAAGLLVARGTLDFVPATLACLSGIFVGDLMLYGAGRLGRPWLERPPLRWLISAADVERSARWFERRGGMVIFLSRFLPGTRLPTYVTAGLLRTSFWWFAMNLFLPVAIWTPLLVFFADLFGDRLFAAFGVFERYALPGFVGAMLVLWAVILLGRSLATWRGRRRLVGWWRRKVKWEFWPPWAFYPPVVLYVLWLGLRHRSLTLFTAANPGMAAGGGFIGESKAEILGRLDPAWVARFEVISGGLSRAEQAAAVERFRAALDLTFPLVIKPDQGQRGNGVSIVRRAGDVEAALARIAGDVIVQEHVPGVELGIFYVRLPDEDTGRIFSITEKVFPAVVGDGHTRLERLILADDRAVAMASVYLQRLAARLDEVPKKGEAVPLAVLGTHCRGAIFLDGAPRGTPALAAAIDQLSRSYPGFYFGRFDVRAKSFAALAEGRDWKVVELNGVTSEATHIYDPANSLLDAWRILFAQWRLAFTIGARNRDRGVRPASVRELLGWLRAARRGTVAQRTAAVAATAAAAGETAPR